MKRKYPLKRKNDYCRIIKHNDYKIYISYVGAKPNVEAHFQYKAVNSHSEIESDSLDHLIKKLDGNKEFLYNINSSEI